MEAVPIVILCKFGGSEGGRNLIRSRDRRELYIKLRSRISVLVSLPPAKSPLERFCSFTVVAIVPTPSN